MYTGDGNIHLQISTPDFDEEVNAKLEPFIFEYTAKLHGSISAEHGIGFKKAKYLHFSKDQSAIDLMKLMKRTMDPNSILNPYKVICWEVWRKDFFFFLKGGWVVMTRCVEQAFQDFIFDIFRF